MSAKHPGEKWGVENALALGHRSAAGLGPHDRPVALPGGEGASQKVGEAAAAVGGGVGSPVQPPPRVVWLPLLELALREDLGTAGDLTSQATVDAEQQASVVLAARRSGVVAGLAIALEAFRLLDREVDIERLVADGDTVEDGEQLARLTGNAQALLAAERTVLNLLSRLCGIATATRDLVERVEAVGARARIVCTRKTTAGLRALEKYAVRCGGGANHRFGLGDAVLIKDNHIAFAGGIENALERAFAHVGHTVKVEVEVDTLEQLEVALRFPVDIVLLDNMSPDQLRTAVQMIREAEQRGGKKMLAEASGGIRPETVAEVAATGVDLISVGYLTHSAPALDVGLDWLAAS